MTRETFASYMERCLYGESGFYARHGEAGRARGDFITSPEVGPLFGAVIGRALDGWWDDLDRPERFVVVEVGAGRGALALSVLAARPRCEDALRYVTVERSERLRAAQRELLGDRVEIRAELPDAPFAGVILANELLDNVPFRIVVGGEDIFVVDGVPSADPRAGLPRCDDARAWVEAARSSLTAGRVVAIDYGVRRTAELENRDWLRTYRDHERGSDPFDAPGTRDITTDVPFDQLPTPDSLATQAEFLRRWGIDDLVDEGRRIWAKRSHIGDLEAVRARSRVTEAAALIDPEGLGAFLVAEWTVDQTATEIPTLTTGGWRAGST